MRTFISCSLLIGTLAASASSYATTKLVFVTSTTGTGDLSSWAEIQAIPDPKPTGLAAGDAICRARATAANLPDPQTFVGWLSDSNNDAYCRIFGFTGKKSTNCGQAQLPTGAGPWMRVDGEPFVEMDGSYYSPILTPLNVDEQGNALPSSEGAFTGTTQTGEVSINGTCNDWKTINNPVLMALGGSVAGTSSTWTSKFIFDCIDYQHLICLEAGAGDPLPNKTQWGKPGAFLSENYGLGNLSAWWGVIPPGITGLAAADAICHQEALDQGFYQPNSYKAYLSGYDGMGNPINAIDRFENDGPWIRPDGLIFADEKDSLTGMNGSRLRRPLDVIRTGVYFSDAVVWTGTNANGTLQNTRHCGNWSSSSSNDSGGTGRTGTIDFDWVAYGQSVCDDGSGLTPANNLYCLSDADVIFWNKFEQPSL